MQEIYVNEITMLQLYRTVGLFELLEFKLTPYCTRPTGLALSVKTAPLSSL
jgi:hypothetical protein